MVGVPSVGLGCGRRAKAARAVTSQTHRQTHCRHPHRHRAVRGCGGRACRGRRPATNAAVVSIDATQREKKRRQQEVEKRIEVRKWRVLLTCIMVAACSCSALQASSLAIISSCSVTHSSVSSRSSRPSSLCASFWWTLASGGGRARAAGTARRCDCACRRRSCISDVRLRAALPRCADCIRTAALLCSVRSLLIRPTCCRAARPRCRACNTGQAVSNSSGKAASKRLCSPGCSALRPPLA